MNNLESNSFEKELKSLSLFIHDYRKIKDWSTDKEQINRLVTTASKISFDAQQIIPENLQSEYTIKLKRALSICKKIEKELELSEKDNSIEQSGMLKESIEKTEGLCKETLLNLEKKELPPFNFVAAFDLDAEDHNYSMTNVVNYSFKNDIPVITTASIMEKLPDVTFTAMYSEGSVYREIGGNFVLILSQNSSKEEVDLTLLGLNDKKFEKVKEENIFNGPHKDTKTTIDNFIDLFTKDSPCEKRIAVAGHGSEGIIGGLTIKNYHRLLSAFSKPEQKCGYFDITSCHGAGVNILEHYIEDADLNKTTPPFPMVIRATADVPSSGLKYFKDIFKNFDDFKNDVLDTAKTMGLYQNVPDNDESYLQMQFPRKNVLPQGFRVVPIKNSSLSSLTYTEMRARELRRDEKIIFKTKLISLNPLVITIPLEKIGESPILLSGVAGNSHHYISKMELTQNTLNSMVLKTGQFLSEAKSNKALFFKKFKDTEREYENVIVSFLYNSATCLRSYKEDEKTIYERVVGEKVEQIDKKDFIIEVSQSLLLTTPKEESVWLSTGGQESDQQFLDELKESFLDENSQPLFVLDKGVLLKFYETRLKTDLENNQVKKFAQGFLNAFRENVTREAILPYLNDAVTLHNNGKPIFKALKGWLGKEDNLKEFENFLLDNNRDDVYKIIENI